MKNLKLLTLTLIISQCLSPLALAGSFSVKAWSEDLKKTLDSDPAKITRALDTKKWQSLQTKALQSSKSKDSKIMKRARKLFEAEKFTKALSEYEKIPRGNDHWLEAVEEKGWVYHRQKKYQKALAQTKTLLSQAFTPIIGSEPFFLQSLSQLKICDYKGILETHQAFKETQRQRLIDLRELSATGQSPAVVSLISKVDEFPLNFTAVGEEAKSLPRLFHRDIALQKALMSLKMSQFALEEIERRQTVKVSQKSIDALKHTFKKAQNDLKTRMKALADIENEENFKMVQKLNLIEVETIQRIHADQELDQDSFKKGEFTQVTANQMVFPDDGHPWIDELDKYEVRVNSCPGNIRRKM